MPIYAHDSPISILEILKSTRTIEGKAAEVLTKFEMARADFFEARTAHGPEPLAQ